MDMQERIAARRAEIERNRYAEEAAAQAIADGKDEDDRVRERASDARAKARKAAIKARDAERAASPASRKQRNKAANSIITKSSNRQWETVDKLIVGVPIVGGLLLLSSHPIWAVILIVLGGMLYVGARASHREATPKPDTELAEATAKPEVP
jgi:hypothetical protein